VFLGLRFVLDAGVFLVHFVGLLLEVQLSGNGGAGRGDVGGVARATSAGFIVEAGVVQEKGLGGVRGEEVGVAGRGGIEVVEVGVVFWGEVVGGAVLLVFFEGVEFF
jgi:hypothetical protein